MIEKNFESSLKYLGDKYLIANISEARMSEGGTVDVVCDKGRFSFVTDFIAKDHATKGTLVPLFHWRSERRYIEMRNNLRDGFIGEPVGMRIKHIAPAHSNWSNLIVREIDIAQWTLGEQVTNVFATSRDELYCNAILSTESGIKISAEIGVAPTNTPIILHEIIGKGGVITDVAVDTQIEHYPIYLYNSKSTTTFRDIDFELYGLEYDEIAQVRFIAWVLADPSQVDTLQKAYKHCVSVVETLKQSSRDIKNLPV